MRRLASTIILSVLCSISFAQNGSDRLDAFLKTVGKEGIRCEGTFSGFIGSDDPDMKISVIMKGDRYYYSTPESVCWYDGNTLWNGIAVDGELVEVYLSNPSDEEIAASNPFLMMSHHEGFGISAPDSRTLLFTAEDQKEGACGGILKISVTFDAEGHPSVIALRSKLQKASDPDIILKVTAFRTGGISDSDFTFPKSKWPRAEVIDLR